MAKLLLLFALCLLPAIATAQLAANPFLVTGKIYCDTCRCGYETTASKYLPGNRTNSISITHAHTRTKTYF